MTVDITFLGAAGTVTGSKYLVTWKDKKILVDAGVFQGRREWRERNWHTPDVDLASIDAVLLTHAHIDHTGILPRYQSLGLNCPVYCTAATSALCEVLLLDMAKLQEQEAEYRAARKRSRHNPPLPLYRQEDARKTLQLFRSVKNDEAVKITEGIHATWTRMGHILGAASISLSIGDHRITFSGDIGRYDVPILVNPAPVEFGDLLLIESTYGNRLHKETSPAQELARIVNETNERGGAVLVPSFAVGRTQLILYYLRELKEQGKIPDIPVVIDSPMATSATSIYREHPKDYDEAALHIRDKGNDPFAPGKLAFVTSRDASMKLNKLDEPMIIIAGSGMLSGGRILHHLKHKIDDSKNTLVFVGYQPPGGRGDWIQSGAESLRLFGQEVPIRASIESISGLSAHADRDEMLKWCRASSGTPSNVAIVHGEPDSAKAFKQTLEDEFDWNTFVASYLQTYTL